MPLDPNAAGWPTIGDYPPTGEALISWFRRTLFHCPWDGKFRWKDGTIENSVQHFEREIAPGDFVEGYLEWDYADEFRLLATALSHGAGEEVLLDTPFDQWPAIKAAADDLRSRREAAR